MALQLENTAFTSLFYVYLNSIINFHVSVECLATLKVNPKPMHKREIRLLFIHVVYLLQTFGQVTQIQIYLNFNVQTFRQKCPKYCSLCTPEKMKEKFSDSKVQGHTMFTYLYSSILVNLYPSKLASKL